MGKPKARKSVVEFRTALFNHIQTLVSTNSIPSTVKAVPSFEDLSQKDFRDLVILSVTWNFKDIHLFCFQNKRKELRDRLWSHICKLPWSEQTRARLVAEGVIPRIKRNIGKAVDLFRLCVHPMIQFTEVVDLVRNEHLRTIDCKKRRASAVSSASFSVDQKSPNYNNKSNTTYDGQDSDFSDDEGSPTHHMHNDDDVFDQRSPKRAKYSEAQSGSASSAMQSASTPPSSPLSNYLFPKMEIMNPSSERMNHSLYKKQPDTLWPPISSEAHFRFVPPALNSPMQLQQSNANISQPPLQLPTVSDYSSTLIDCKLPQINVDSIKNEFMTFPISSFSPAFPDSSFSSFPEPSFSSFPVSSHSASVADFSNSSFSSFASTEDVPLW